MHQVESQLPAAQQRMLREAMPDDRESCLRAGANDYVAKPIDVDMLLSLIRVWMSQ